MTLSTGQSDIRDTVMQEGLMRLARAIEERRWAEGLECIAMLRKRDPHFGQERLSEAEHRCLLGQRYARGAELLNSGTAALEADHWDEARGSLSEAAAAFKDVIGRTTGYPLFLDSGDLLRRALEEERRIDPRRALTEARAAGEQRATQILERELQELDRQLGGFERMQQQAVEAFRAQSTELDSEGWQTIIAQLRRIEQLRSQNAWLEDYFIEAPRLIEEAQRARRLSSEVEAGLRLLAPDPVRSGADLPAFVRAIDDLEDVERENPDFFPERVEPALRALRQERGTLGQKVLAEIEQALDHQQRDRAEQLLTVLLQGTPDLAEQHAPRIGRRLQELRYLESIAGAGPYGSPSAGSPYLTPGQAPSGPYSATGNPYGSSLPPQYRPASPYTSPLASQGVAETIVLPAGGAQAPGMGYAPPSYPPPPAGTSGSPSHRRFAFKGRQRWAAVAAALVVVVGGLALIAHLAGGNANAITVPVSSSSQRGCEFLATSFAKLGGQALHCVPTDAAAANIAVQTGKAPFAISTDDLTGAQAATMRSTRVYREMLVLITSRDHPVGANLTLSDVNALFTGGSVDPSHLDPSCTRPSVFIQPINSSESQFLASKAHFRAFAPGLQEVGTDDAMINQVGNHDCSVGFVGSDAVTGEVKPLALAGVDPSSPNFKLQLIAYPLIRWVYLIQRNPDPVKPQPNLDGSSWLKYIISPQGQQALAANGFTPRFQY